MAAAYNVWTAAEHIGALVQGRTHPIELPQKISVRARRMTRFAPCAICNRDLMDPLCTCDPDEQAGAALVAMHNLNNGGQA